MSSPRFVTERDVIYPESDGQPMADNTLQFTWIVTIQGGIDALFQDDPNIFVAGDLFWYPVQGAPNIRMAPDVLVVFGRPKGHRGSYLQWREEDIPPQVVFEVLSPGNTPTEMHRKFNFYERYGVEEYYIYDPDRGRLEGFLRHGDRLQVIPSLAGWRSPRLGIRFELIAGVLRIYRPDGRGFLSYVELHHRAEQAEQRAARLAARLRALGLDAEEADADDAGP